MFTLSGHEHNISSVHFLPSGDQVVSASWDKSIMLWDTSTGFLVKKFEGHEGYIFNLDINQKGNRMVSSSKTKEIIFWDLNVKEGNNILSIFDEEHDNIVDIVRFAPLEAAKTLTKLRNGIIPDEQTGGTDNEEEKKEEEESNGVKDTPEDGKASSTKARNDDLKQKMEDMKRKREARGAKKASAKEDKKEGSKEVEEVPDVIVKDQFVASGSRDKRIKIWGGNKGT